MQIEAKERKKEEIHIRTPKISPEIKRRDALRIRTVRGRREETGAKWPAPSVPPRWASASPQPWPCHCPEPQHRNLQPLLISLS